MLNEFFPDDVVMVRLDDDADWLLATVRASTVTGHGTPERRVSYDVVAGVGRLAVTVAAERVKAADEATYDAHTVLLEAVRAELLRAPAMWDSRSRALLPIGTVVDVLVPSSAGVDVWYAGTVNGYPTRFTRRGARSDIHTVVFPDFYQVHVHRERLRVHFTPGTIAPGAALAGTEFADAHDAHMRAVYSDIENLLTGNPWHLNSSDLPSSDLPSSDLPSPDMGRAPVQDAVAEPTGPTGRVGCVQCSGPALWYCAGSADCAGPTVVCGRGSMTNGWTYYCRQSPAAHGATCTQDSLIDPHEASRQAPWQAPWQASYGREKV